ncbi:minor capsid protein [Halalkalibacterium halodurans]|uniref:phage tail terminator protein n=1 Tax=Halalkalibacterium halodurans TaxID=86665 RepID=UPI002E21C0B8|nr:minor capsid protein [Halalkalibacterium halodurans]MED4084934.1 minor capsid protein [Halalkalibacterium halodurans]MED4104901.1 minor capsid protein [Halalkalibacterium halodurans]MED4110438.1 minor capsid protein [Halalkalibacterium halodurans]MED4123048.1 minor capsid protein [Halalkalibacterium halodurans]
MDFVDRLCDRINEIPGLPVTCKLGYLGTEESLVLYPLPGSRITAKYMDGTSDQQLNYEIAMKSKLQSKISSVLWLVQNELEALEELESQDGSFEFDELVITNKPFINQIDDQGWFVFLLDVQANITVFKEDE